MVSFEVHGQFLSNSLITYYDRIPLARYLGGSGAIFNSSVCRLPFLLTATLLYDSQTD